MVKKDKKIKIIRIFGPNQAVKNKEFMFDNKQPLINTDKKTLGSVSKNSLEYQTRQKAPFKNSIQ